MSTLVEDLEIDHLLDYGCGSNLSLRETFKPNRKVTYQAYDPGVPEYAGEPMPAELVTCIDVLEHIEPECLDDVLDHLESLVELVFFCSIHTGPAGKVLDDGRNAHLIQKSMEWWLPQIWDRFSIQQVRKTGPSEFFVIAYSLGVLND